MKGTAWMIGLMLWVGCTAPKQPGVDPTLPEAVSAVEAVSPVEILVAGTTSEQPSLRARALALLIASSAEKGGGPYALQALGDPDPWVQKNAVDVLTHRLNDEECVERLFQFLSRDDDYVSAEAQGRAALRLLDAGFTARLDAYQNRFQEEVGRPWRTSPWALLSAKMGNEPAQKALAATLSMADVPLEVDFFIELSRSGLGDLAVSMATGQEYVEEELALTYAVARLGLGDRGAESVLKGALDSETESIQIDAIELLGRVSGSDKLLTKAAARSGVVGDLSQMALMARGAKAPDALPKYAGHPDRFVREVAARAARVVFALDTKNATKAARQTVKLTIQDPDPIVRTEAIRTAVAIEFTSLDSELAESLTHELLSVRIEAAGALTLLQATE